MENINITNGSISIKNVHNLQNLGNINSFMNNLKPQNTNSESSNEIKTKTTLINENVPFFVDSDDV